MSRFVGEIPEELLDQKRPAAKRWISAEKEEEIFGKGFSGAKSFGMGTQGSYSRGGSNGYETVFDKPKAAAEKAKPKAAAVAKRRTPAENRPFISGGVSALKGVDGLSKGMTGGAGAPDYGVGDRVKHVKYGEGMVMNIEKGPRDYQVTVVFDGAGQKIMYAAFAKLKKI